LTAVAPFCPPRPPVPLFCPPSRPCPPKALVFYTEGLRSSDVLVQQGSCLALKCLKAVESVDHIADLWRSADEDLRGSARETVLSFGKKGYQAFQRMDQLYSDLEEEAYQNQETQTTIL
ncbi:RIPOR family member 3-like, partial [Salarias fasciatus]|uniref:RIPOR family member 3-like n=1 Tax=Salarias fasciatus TaxID=181472 RepID=UPI001176697D